MWNSLFSLTNFVALVGWALLIFAPRRPGTYSLILFAGVGLLCITYATLLGLLVCRLIDPGVPPGSTGADFKDMTIAGIRSLFATDAGVVIGWTHYLALDLFVGLWIGRDADNKGFGRVAQVPFLLLTYFAGPLGLLLWLVARERRARALAKAQKA